MSEMNAESEALFDRVVRGELAPDAEAVRRQAAVDPGLARALEEWDRVDDAVRRAEAEREAEMREAERDLRAEDVVAARRFIDRQVSRESSPSPMAHPLWRRPLVLVAAAALLVLAFLLSRPGGEAQPDGVSGPLSEQPEDRAMPQGEVDSFDVFQVPHEVPASGTLEISVYRAADGLLADPVVSVRLRAGMDPELAETPVRWQPTEDERQRMGRSIRWNYKIIVATTELVVSEDFRASLP